MYANIKHVPCQIVIVTVKYYIIERGKKIFLVDFERNAIAS